MVNFLLPQLNAQGPDYAGSFMQGLQIPYAIQGMQGRNELMNLEREKRKAIKEYAETGDINTLKRAPETYIHMRKLEKEEKTQDLGLQKLGFELGKAWLPYLKANPTVENYQEVSGILTTKFGLSKSNFPPLETPEQITAHIEKIEQAMMSPKDRAAMGPKAPTVKEYYDEKTGLKRKGQWTPETGWQPFGGLAKETEEQKGEYNRLIEFHNKIREGQEITEDSLADLSNKFNKRGLNLNNSVDFQAAKQASISLSRNLDFNTLDPSKPEHAAKREQMLIDETARLKRGMTGQGGRKVIPPSYPATIQKADGVYTKTDQVDPRTGKPIYKAPNGELVLPK